MASTQQVPVSQDSEEKLLADLEESKTLPLWKQMAQLNPPEPNPTTVPFVWNYKSIRPNLLRAGQLVTEKQAERRVLMLVNPARGKHFPAFEGDYFPYKVPRCAIYHRHSVRRTAAGDAQRDRACAPSCGFCDAIHYRREWRLYSRPWPPHQDATSRRDPDAHLELP